MKTYYNKNEILLSVNRSELQKMICASIKAVNKERSLAFEEAKKNGGIMVDSEYWKSAEDMYELYEYLSSAQRKYEELYNDWISEE